MNGMIVRFPTFAYVRQNESNFHPMEYNFRGNAVLYVVGVARPDKSPEFNSVIPSISLLVEKRCQILQESLIQYLSSLAAKLDELEQKEKFSFKSQKQLISDPAFAGSIAAVYDGSSINEILHLLIQDVHVHAIDLISTLTDVESFINFKIPKCETGNNFELEVQELVIRLTRQN